MGWFGLGIHIKYGETTTFVVVKRNPNVENVKKATRLFSPQGSDMTYQ